MSRILWPLVGMMLGIFIVAANEIFNYMSGPPGASNDPALDGLFFNVLFLGIPLGIVIWLSASKILGLRFIRKKQSKLVLWYVKRKKKILIQFLFTFLVAFFLLFYQHPSKSKLSINMASLSQKSYAQGLMISWNTTNPNLLTINIPPKSQPRIYYKNISVYYYLAFYRARLLSGYSILTSPSCTVEIRQRGLVVQRKSSFLL